MASTSLGEGIFERTASKSLVMLAGSSIQKPCRIDTMGPKLTGKVLYYQESKALLLAWLLDFDVVLG